MCAAVGAVYDRESIAYESVEIPGLARVATYGIEGSPALAVILAAIGGFGPAPNLVVSGINEGLNTGRSALHSGTIGAVLTTAQFGISGLAVGIAWAKEPIPWETPVHVASDLVPALTAMVPATVLNLNVPSVPAGPIQRSPPRHPGQGGSHPCGAPEHTPEPVAGPPLDRTTGSIPSPSEVPRGRIVSPNWQSSNPVRHGRHRRRLGLGDTPPRSARGRFAHGEDVLAAALAAYPAPATESR